MRAAILSLLTTTTLIACGPTAREKDLARAKQPTVASRFLDGPQASSAWTDAELDQYEARLEAAVRADDGRYAAGLAHRRVQLSAARALKTSEGTSAQVARVRAQGEVVDQMVAHTLVVKYGEAVDAFEKEYLNNPTITVVDVPAANRALDQILALNAQIQRLKGLSDDERAQFADARTSLEALRDAIGRPVDSAVKAE